MAGATSLRITGGCLVLLVCLCGHSAAAAGGPSNVERFLAIAAELNLGAPLPRAREKLRTEQSITIVALGSSSTTGFGTFGLGFPAVMKAELSRRHPTLHVALFNSARVFETVNGNLARLDSDVLRYKPDLVVWQLGTNDVMWRGVGSAATAMRDGVRRLKQAGAEVILMDLQDAPIVRRKASHDAMQNLIADVAREEAVSLFPRFLLMQHAHAQGVKGLVAWDGLHNSAAGYRCIGLALARMIDADTAR